jgi:hypothetical protein
MAPATRILIPDVVYELSEEETDMLIKELWATDRPGASFDANAAAERLERPTHADPHEFPEVEALALLRALENLRWSGRLHGREQMIQLKDTLVGTLNPRPIGYELRLLDNWAKTQGWASYSGPFDVGDRLSTTEADWRVTDVEQREHGDDLLTCQPFAEEWPPHEPPPFSAPAA